MLYLSLAALTCSAVTVLLMFWQAGPFRSGHHKLLSRQATIRTFADSSIADSINHMYNDVEGGVFIRMIGQGWIRPWEGCESSSDPCSAYARVGSLSFLLLNRLYWDTNTSRLRLPDHGRSGVGHTADMGFIGTELTRQQTVVCMFTIDGWSWYRFNNGCGCTTQSDKHITAGPLRNFSKHPTDGWQGDCHQPNHEDWCTARPGPRTISLSNSTVECPERFGCAWRPSELKLMMQDYKANLDNMPHLCTKWNEVVVNASKWNQALLTGNIQAFFIRADKCMPGSACYKDFVRWSSDYQAEFGARPVLVLNVTNETKPFSLFKDASYTRHSETVYFRL